MSRCPLERRRTVRIVLWLRPGTPVLVVACTLAWLAGGCAVDYGHAPPSSAAGARAANGTRPHSAARQESAPQPDGGERWAAKARLTVPPADARARARLLIESVERISSCRYVIDGMLVSADAGGERPAATFIVLALGYRGPELQCRLGLEILNLDGAALGLAFVGTRVSLAGRVSLRGRRVVASLPVQMCWKPYDDGRSRLAG